MTINFYLDSRVDKRGDAPVRVSIMAEGLRCVTTAGVKVSPSRWDAAKQRAKRGGANADAVSGEQINSSLSALISRVEVYVAKCAKCQQTPTVEGLKRAVRGAATTDRKGDTTLEALYNKFIIEEGRASHWSARTIASHKATLRNLTEWRKDATLADLTGDGVADFVGWLATTSHMLNSSIMTRLDAVKWFAKWAMRKGYAVAPGVIDFKSGNLKHAKNPVVYLEWEELMRLFNLDLSNITPRYGWNKTQSDYSHVVRDIFCFCCFTSLRFSDVANLTWANVHGGHIEVTQIKTGKVVRIELNKYAAQILDRHRDNGGKIFPKVCQSKLGAILPTLCLMADITAPVQRVRYSGATRLEESGPKWQFVTSHTARRTFICNALLMGIAPHVVMKWTGHANYSAMQPYIDATDAAKAEAMQKFNER